jgi:hypothetical protein
MAPEPADINPDEPELALFEAAAQIIDASDPAVPVWALGPASICCSSPRDLLRAYRRRSARWKGRSPSR